ncbi:hypothetical protein [Myroides pelagicus]|uniref:Uncharacterized protein n=1 Tax=Myroides pelagicus TaxID=270914 RepID=A0A7K1GIX1_9FLAO|nr:hypothetical protein [Myroides pelagicus]MTH28393.1 hypothetical protein [Myroides pelagicus]
MKQLILKYFAKLVLITEPFVKISDRLDYYIAVVIRLAPIAMLLDLISWWFSENKQFGQFMCMAIFINMIVGAIFHFKNNSFSWPAFFKRNMFMAGSVSVVYVMLEMLRYTAGDNLAGEIFKITIQITTLLYPTSKVMKNIYIMTNGKYPPEFIMKKLYDFEKNGDLKAFFETKNKEE